MQVSIIFNPKIKKDKFKLNKFELLQDFSIPIYIQSFKDLYPQMKNLCPGILYSFIKDSLNSDFIITLVSRKKLVGFVSLSILRNKSLFIDLICTSKSKGLGTYLIDLIREIGKKIQIKYIKTDSLDTAVSFYLKNNFYVSQDTCKMAYLI
jgi:hypothetical protein